MHCVACNKDYIDLCRVCFEDVKGLFPVLERKDLITEADLDPSEQDVDMTMESSLEVDTRDCIDYIYYIVSNDNYEDS
jgi:hypothetical protein